MKQKTDLEKEQINLRDALRILSENCSNMLVTHEPDLQLITSNEAIKCMDAALSLKSNQLQATVDELKQRCEELEKYAYQKNGCNLNTLFGTEKDCSCGLDNLLARK